VLAHQGSLNLLYRYITRGRAEDDRPPTSPRSLARLVLSRPDHLSDRKRWLRHERVAAPSASATFHARCPRAIELWGMGRRPGG
jgi:hypothetical protein